MPVPGLPRRRRPRGGSSGTPVARLDLPDKVFGRPRFVHDLALPGLLHGRVLKPASPGAKLTSLEEAGARGVAGVIAVVRDGSFAGVVAETEEAAEAGLAALAQGRELERRASRCPTRPTSPAGSRASPPTARPSTRGRRRRPRSAVAHDPAAVHAPVHCPCLDGAFLRDRAMAGPGELACLVALPGRLQLACRPRYRLRAAAREHRRRARRGCRLLRPQRRRRRGLRCGAAGARRRRASGARAMVARGRACLVAGGRGHGHRSGSRPRCRRRHRALAP